MHMIISASRRTDIPRFYFPWLINRLREGYVLARNPMNFHQVSRISLSPDVVDCIVFWTKNPAPMLALLPTLREYAYYIQYTIHPYASDIEKNLPPLSTRLDTFRAFSDILGPERMVWRYSPALFNEKYPPDLHLEQFDHICARLEGYTLECKFSFLDIYRKIEKRMRSLGVKSLSQDERNGFARSFAKIAASHGITACACCNVDADATGMRSTGCINAALISKITGYDYDLRKDPGQRDICRCAQSVDIGAYDTCLNGCAYCYANYAQDVVHRNYKAHDENAPLLCGSLVEGDIVTERKAVSNKVMQMNMFD